MLIGEHAVVYGHPSIVCAVNQRVTVRLSERSDERYKIETPVAPTFRGLTSDLPTSGALKFVSASLRSMRLEQAHGLDVAVHSEIDPTLGLGSSAAVTIALLGALNELGVRKLKPGELHAKALNITRGIQGRGSGADLAASLHGGCLAYKLVEDATERMADIDALPLPPTLSLCYTGYKTPTGDVLAQVAAARQGREAHFDSIYNRMGEVSALAIGAVRREDWSKLAKAMAEYQELMRELGVSDAKIEQIIKAAKGAMAAKISGSGLGDCVLALGDAPKGFSAICIAKQGLLIHDD